MEEGDDWLGLAENLPPRTLRRRIRKRIEEVKQRKKVKIRDLCATEDTWDKFDRMRD